MLWNFVFRFRKAIQTKLFIKTFLKGWNSYLNKFSHYRGLPSRSTFSLFGKKVKIFKRKSYPTVKTENNKKKNEISIIFLIHIRTLRPGREKKWIISPLFQSWNGRMDSKDNWKRSFFFFQRSRAAESVMYFLFNVSSWCNDALTIS